MAKATAPISPRDLQQKLAADFKRQQSRNAIALRRLIYTLARAELGEVATPDPSEVAAILAANGRDAESLFREDGTGDVDNAIGRLTRVRIREKEGDALKRQADHSRRQREAFIRWEREDRERAQQRAQERAELNSENAEIVTVINAAQQARIELFSLPLDEADAREETEARKELDAVNASILEIQRFNRDHSTLASFPNYQELQEKKSRLTNKLEFIKARRCEIPDFEFELELLDEADSPEQV